MDEYMNTMENYSPVSSATSQMMSEAEIIRMDEVPNTTGTIIEEQPSEARYLAPKTIEVRRYTLKK